MSLVKCCLINSLMVRNFVSHQGGPTFKQRPKYHNNNNTLKYPLSDTSVDQSINPVEQKTVSVLCVTSRTRLK